MRLKSENELLSLLCLIYPKSAYPKVKRIARTPISPDIDLLRVEEEPFNEKAPLPLFKRRRLTGYEVKLLKYSKRSKNFPLAPFYEALGEALCYLQHGVHRTNVVLGTEYVLDKEDTQQSNEYRRITEYVLNMGATLKDFCHHIGIYWFDWEWGSLTTMAAHAEEDYQINPKLSKAYKRESLQRLQFSYAKKFLRNALKRTPPWPEG